MLQEVIHRSQPMQASKYLWIFGSIIFGLLGVLHMLLTFFTNSFDLRNTELMQTLKQTNLRLNEDLSMWKAWIGFNASHSSGIIFIAVTNCFLAIRFYPMIQKNDWYFIFSICTIGFYVFLAWKYWFTPPLIGTSVTLVLYIAAYVLTKF